MRADPQRPPELMLSWFSRLEHCVDVPGQGFALGAEAPPGVDALRRLRSQDLPLACFQLFTQRHAVISRKKLVPWSSLGTPKFDASVWPRSANVALVPSEARGLTPAPVASNGTCSLE